VVRQDPDVLACGEIRDEETLSVTIQSALSGVLTLACMHADDAPAAPVRMLDMGCPPYVLATSLTLVVAQRLVRRLCPECKQPGQLSAEEAEVLPLAEGSPVYRPGWCDQCDRTGYYDRVGVFELMPVTGELRDLIMREARAEDLREAAWTDDTHPLLQSGTRYVQEGITAPQEVIRVLR
jgi:type II secretory ATPase GspE/PulE/Tfp pilus assembly ATPase PilB-like protein